MKQALFFLLLFSPVIAQKNYVFDYLLEYDFQLSENSEIQKRYMLTNSKDNTYDLLYWQSSVKDLNIFFSEDLEGIQIRKTIPIREFFSNEKLFFNCNEFTKHRVRSIYDEKKYKFTIHNDSVMLTDTLKHYQMDIVSNKLKKKYEFGTSHYLVANETQFHLPLMQFSETFDVRITSKSVPNEIAKEIYTINDFRHTKEYYYKLIVYLKIKKEVVISDPCQLQNN